MKMLFIPVAAALTLAVSTTAFGESTTHTIKYMDAKKGTMTLMNGRVFMLATKELTSQYEVGDTVLVTLRSQMGSITLQR